MSVSHLQTRTLTDALDRVDAILATRGTRLKASEDRNRLAGCFARKTPREFNSWAYSASEYEDVLRQVRSCSPELLDRLQEPLDQRDFHVVGHFSLDLRFATLPNGAEQVPHALRDGTAVLGARVTPRKGRLYSSGMVSLPAIDGRHVYFFQPPEPPGETAAQLASTIFRSRGDSSPRPLQVTFPQSRTKNLPDDAWVDGLESEDALYRVKGCVNSGEAIVDENGFFARETVIIPVQYLCMLDSCQEVLIDGPFLVFYAEDAGVHAAAWFDRDSFKTLD